MDPRSEGETIALNRHHNALTQLINDYAADDTNVGQFSQDITNLIATQTALGNMGTMIPSPLQDGTDLNFVLDELPARMQDSNNRTYYTLSQAQLQRMAREVTSNPGAATTIPNTNDLQQPNITIQSLQDSGGGVLSGGSPPGGPPGDGGGSGGSGDGGRRPMPLGEVEFLSQTSEILYTEFKGLLTENGNSYCRSTITSIMCVLPHSADTNSAHYDAKNLSRLYPLFCTEHVCDILALNENSKPRDITPIISPFYDTSPFNCQQTGLDATYEVYTVKAFQTIKDVDLAAPVFPYKSIIIPLIDVFDLTVIDGTAPFVNLLRKFEGGGENFMLAPLRPHIYNGRIVNPALMTYLYNLGAELIAQTTVFDARADLASLIKTAKSVNNSKCTTILNTIRNLIASLYFFSKTPSALTQQQVMNDLKGIYDFSDPISKLEAHTVWGSAQYIEKNSFKFNQYVSIKRMAGVVYPPLVKTSLSNFPSDSLTMMSYSLMNQQDNNAQNVVVHIGFPNIAFDAETGIVATKMICNDGSIAFESSIWLDPVKGNRKVKIVSKNKTMGDLLRYRRLVAVRHCPKPLKRLDDKNRIQQNNVLQVRSQPLPYSAYYGVMMNASCTASQLQLRARNQCTIITANCLEEQRPT